MNIPNHLAIVLDGNRRWARIRGLPPWKGHWKGGLVFDNLVDWCLELGIPQVSVFALSSENLNRPKRELQELFDVYYDSLKRWEKKMAVLDKYEVKVRFLGNLDKLPLSITKLMGRFMTKTAKYQKKFVNILVAYGGQSELTTAIKSLAEKMIKTGKIEITQKNIQSHLLVATPVDLVIRTGGFSRLSNFLLWQTAYAEIYVTKTLWPDFTKEELIKAIKWYNSIKRNFGR